MFLFTLTSLSKNEEFLIASNTQIRSFLIENARQPFPLHLGEQNALHLSEIFAQVEQSQIYFEQ